MRLIDTDKAIKMLNSNTLDGMTMIAFLETQPVAYDVDKIVEELEKAKHEIASEDYCRSINDKGKCDGRNCFECCAEYLIEIVKQGGVADDVCEWRLCDEEANVYDTSCRNPHILIEGTPKENNYEYCPYCGKNIKVVE